MSEPLRLALVSSSSLVLAGLRAGLDQGDGIAVVAGAGSLGELRDAGFADAQLVIVDLGSGGDLAGLAEAAEDGPPLLLLAPEPPGNLADVLALGCSVLLRQAPVETLLAAARAAAAGLVVGTPSLLASAIRFGGAPPAVLDFEPLTPREREVLRQMSLGLGNREIADILNISSHTAKFHVAQIIAKLDASSRTHAVAKGLRAGLVEL